MPIFGYVAIPEKGKLDTLCIELQATQHCEVIRAENREILILVTDTPDEPTEKALKEKLKAIKHIQSLSMTFGYNDEHQNETQRGENEA